MNNVLLEMRDVTMAEVLILASILAITATFYWPSESHDLVSLQRGHLDQDKLAEAKTALIDYHTQMYRYSQLHKAYASPWGQCAVDPDEINRTLHSFKLSCAITASGYEAEIRGTDILVVGFIYLIEQAQPKGAKSISPGSGPKSVLCWTNRRDSGCPK